MRILLVFSLATLAACQSAVPFEPVTDQCNSLQYLSLVGTKVDDIKPGQFPEGTRFMESALPAQDQNPERLNVISNKSGRITHIECG